MGTVGGQSRVATPTSRGGTMRHTLVEAGEASAPTPVEPSTITWAGLAYQGAESTGPWDVTTDDLGITLNYWSSYSIDETDSIFSRFNVFVYTNDIVNSDGPRSDSVPSGSTSFTPQVPAGNAGETIIIWVCVENFPSLATPDWDGYDVVFTSTMGYSFVRLYALTKTRTTTAATYAESVEPEPTFSGFDASNYLWWGSMCVPAGNYGAGIDYTQELPTDSSDPRIVNFGDGTVTITPWQGGLDWLHMLSNPG